MAIKGTVGQNVATTSYFPPNYTTIDKRNPCTAAGVIKTVTVTLNVNTPQTGKLKFFRINGTNYDVIYDQTVTGLSNGENTVTLTTPLNVQIGDLIGWWTGISGSVSEVGLAAGAAGGNHQKANADVTTTTAIATWASDSSTVDITANILSIPVGGMGFGNPQIY